MLQPRAPGYGRDDCIRSVAALVMASLRAPVTCRYRSTHLYNEGALMTKRTAAELFGADVVVLAVLLHLAEQSKGLTDGPFKAGWDSAIEEAGAYIDSVAKDGRDTMQTLMEQVVGLMNGSYVLMETPQRPLGVVPSTVR